MIIVGLLSYLTVYATEINPEKASKLNKVAAQIVIDYTAVGNQVSPLLYGNNIKWLLNGEARNGYDSGIWSVKTNRVKPKLKDILNSSGITILRYGDGTNADYFYWGWTLPTIKERLKRKVFTRWGNNENYIFGIMEFIKLTQMMKCKSVVIVNYGMGILGKFYDTKKHHDNRTKLEIAIQQAANLVEFMNVAMPKNSSIFPKTYKPEYSLQKMPKGYFAYLRGQLGVPKPLGIKYWEIGNEIYMFHISGSRAVKEGWTPAVKAISMTKYTKNAFKFSKAMKAVDPMIKTGLVEYTKELKAQVALTEKSPGAVDFIIPHDYIKGTVIGKNPVYTFFGAGNKGGMHRKFFFPKSGIYTLNIRAWSRAYFGTKFPREYGVPTQIEVQIDGKKAGVIVLDKNIDIKGKKVNKKFYNYTMKLKLDKGEHDIYLYHSNDFFDKTFNDVNRRGRDAFADKIYIEGYGKTYKLINQHRVAAYYAQLVGFRAKIKKFCDTVRPSKLLVAQTESAVFPPPDNLSAALCEAGMIMEDMKNGIFMRNHWVLYGTCQRSGVIHATRDNSYHCTPSYYIIQMFSNFFGNQLVKTTAESPMISLNAIARMDVDEKNADISIPGLWTLAAKSKTNQLTVAIVNFYHNKELEITLEIKGFKPKNGVIHSLQTKNVEDYAANNEQVPDNVAVISRQLGKELKTITVAPNSFSIVTFNHE